VLDGYWDTHSSKSAMAMACVARVAQEQGFAAALVTAMAQANTVEAAMETIKHEAGARDLWITIERRIGALVQARVPSVRRVEVRLFDLSGNGLGASVGASVGASA
jgi:cobalt-precorrin-5B (C1)-methyltransferase